MEPDIIALQEAVAHQGDDILRLSDELYTQQKEIAMLHRKLASLQAKFAAATDDSGAAPHNVDQEPPPPHY